jgi:4-diphosphocytidyl-2-C-methyl-D-erythritol kinase
MRLLAPAKINLHLRVGRPRADGFHPLVTWMCTVKLFDTLIVDRASGSGVAMRCDRPGLACDQSNLVVKAAGAMAQALRKDREGLAGDEFGLSILLQKRIPLGAGLGGGSSDGARVLLGLNRLWAAGWTRARLAALAASLGSDLPFFLHGSSAVCRGRGELVDAFFPPPIRFALLVMPGRHLATADVYRRFDQMGLGDPAALEHEPAWQQWARFGALELLPCLVNDLEQAAFAVEPQLGVLRTGLERELGRAVRMSGSGSSLFTLYDQEQEAFEAGSRVSQRFGIEAVTVELAPRFEDDI